MESNERETEALKSEMLTLKDQVSVLEERISREEKIIQEQESDFAMEILVEKQIRIANLEIELMDARAQCMQREISMGQIQRDTSLRIESIKKKKDLLVSLTCTVKSKTSNSGRALRIGTQYNRPLYAG